MSYNFNKDLIRGKKYENLLLNTLINNNIDASLNTSPDIKILEKYDLITSKNIKIEVKLDTNANKYNSLFIETYRETKTIYKNGETIRRQETGIKKTECDYYIFYNGNNDNNPYIIKFNDLKQIIINNIQHLKIKTTRPAQYGNKSILTGGLILPISYIDDYLIKIDEFLLMLK